MAAFPIVHNFVTATALAAGVLLTGAGCSTVATTPAAETAAVSETAETPAQSEAKAGSSFRDCPDCPEMVIIPSGSFLMGSPADEAGREDDEGPQHRVNISRFALGKYEVTQGEWKAIVGNNPSYFPSCGDDCPVEGVSWDDVQEFIQVLNQKTGQNYRLPSEAEWEYAARAGTATPFHTGNAITTDQANFDGSYPNGSGKGVYRKTTTPAGSFAPNAFGLHDMHGNVWEWVADCYHSSYSGAPADGSAWMEGCKLSYRVREYRIARGGSWYHNAQNLRSANRYMRESFGRYPRFGFRIARDD